MAVCLLYRGDVVPKVRIDTHHFLDEGRSLIINHSDVLTLSSDLFA